MAGLDVRPVGVSIPVEVVGSWSPPRQPAFADEDALLLEAIRFHEFSIIPVYKPSTFPRFEGTPALGNALPGLRRYLHDQAAQFLDVLAGPLEGKVVRPGGNVRGELLDDQVRQLRRETLSARRAQDLRDGVPQADGGRAAMRTLLSRAWRNPNRVDQLRNPKKQVLFRRFEDLDAALLDLRTMITRSGVEAAMRAAFGPALVDKWGGDRVIRRPERQESSAPGGGYSALGETQVGLTEKLYQEFATKVFEFAHGTARAPENKSPSPYAIEGQDGPFQLHLKVRKQIDFILHESLFLPTKLPPSPPTTDGRAAVILPTPFSAWFANLDTLETCFATASRAPETAKLAIEVGLPWGVALVTVLRAYLVELIGRTMMAALPIEHAHKALDGNLAVALWEAQAGQNAPHPSRTGYLVPVKQGEAPPAEHPLLHALQAWNPTGQEPAAFVKAWPTVPWHAQAAQVLRGMTETRCLIPGAKPKGNQKQPAPDSSDKLEDHIHTWPTYPIASIPGVRTSDEGTNLRIGASLSAQGHLYVAAWILGKAVDFGVPMWNPKDDDTGDGAGLHLQLPPPPGSPAPPPLTSALQLGDGSYLWGGRFPPHTTHLDGATFDLRFGPECLAWVETDLKKDLEFSDDAVRRLQLELNSLNTARLGIIGTSCDPKEQPARQPSDHVLLKLVADLIRKLLKDGRTKLQGSGPKGQVKGYNDIEKQLMGTPHFCSTRGAQQVLAGHVAILLSGPTQLIFGSPINHLRAMNAIHSGFRATSLRHAAAELLEDAAFVFKPQDHNNHWHVHYNPLVTAPRSPKKTPVERFVEHFQIWSALGVDFAPFLQYLKELKLIQAGGPQLAQASEELHRLKEEIQNYQEAYKRPDPDRWRLLGEILLCLSIDADADLLVPAATRKLSSKLRAVAVDSEVKLRKAKSSLSLLDLDRLQALEKRLENLEKLPLGADESDEIE